MTRPQDNRARSPDPPRPAGREAAAGGDWTAALVRWGEARGWRPLPVRGALAAFRAEAFPAAGEGFAADKRLREDYTRLAELPPPERARIAGSPAAGAELEARRRRPGAVAVWLPPPAEHAEAVRRGWLSGGYEGHVAGVVAAIHEAGQAGRRAVATAATCDAVAAVLRRLGTDGPQGLAKAIEALAHEGEG